MTARLHQVFVSSTFEDLQAERQAITEVLLQSGCMPAGMELFTASGQPPWSTITRALDLCDYMVLILGGRYGSMLDETGLSYTENEYEYALDKGIHVLPFVHQDISLLPSAHVSSGKAARQLRDFKSKVTDSGRHTASFWKTPEDLRQKVAVAVPAAIRNDPRPGWVRGSAIPTEAARTSQSPSQAALSALTIDRADDAALAPLVDSSGKLDDFVDRRTKELLRSLPEPTPPSATYGIAGVLAGGNILGVKGRSSIRDLYETPEDRSEEEFRQEVHEYSQALRPALDKVVRSLAAQQLLPLALQVHNGSETNLRQVEVVLHLAGDVEAVERDDSDYNPMGSLPSPPRKWGPRNDSITALAGAYSSVSGLDFSGAARGTQPEIINGGSVTIKFPPFHLRPEGSHLLDEVVLLIGEASPRTIQGTWSVTATNVDAVAKGNLVLQLEAAPRDLWQEWVDSDETARMQGE